MRLSLAVIISVSAVIGAIRAQGDPIVGDTGPTWLPTTAGDDADRCWWLSQWNRCAKNCTELFSGSTTGASDLFAAFPSLNGTVVFAPPALSDRTGKSSDAWAAPVLRQDGVHRVATGNLAADWADLSGKVKLRERDANLDPAARNSWESDETVKLPVGSSVFLFNQVTGSTPAVEQQQYKWLGKTGVGVKLKPWLFQEVQLRTGPAVRYDDTGTLTKGQSPERSELFLEAVTKVPVPVVGPVNLEYSSYAVPAATSADHNQINQDFKVALPIGGGQFHVGAKYKWEAASSTPWMDRMQLYLGVQNKW